ncbi:MAG TPA: leucyl aminopeptidase [Thermoanaerobaculia bacterium]|jgi:leucyl aminopeptidase|nr:leucyl aminopeptidase [Thermoanaerobaculia bacterium]
MDVTITREPKVAKADHLFVLIAENSKPDVAVAAQAMKAIADAGFTGKAEDSLTTVAGEPKKITLIGIGKQDALTIRILRTALYSIAKMARKQRDRNIVVVLPYSVPKLDADETTRVAAAALSGSDYKYDTYITKKEDKSLPVSALLVPPDGVDAKRAKQLDLEAKAVAAGIRTVRDLGNAPGNLATATFIGHRAEEVAKEVGIKCAVYGKREIEKMKMGGLLAVNKGSAEEPRFIVLEYAPRKATKHVALVGKGITFDSGGISIKPSEKMEEMKFDMCGAAAVIGTIQAAAMLALPVRVTGVIASTDNLPSGSAYKPGDIVTTMSGKTIEIVNTDAEGRVILSDALHYASELKPDHIIDYATLTGACVVALASEAAGLFSNNDELAQKLIECGERVGERLWRLPEWDDYKELIRSDWADMKNSGGRWGGATTAAVFLKEFVNCPSWAHLDIAGTAYAEHETSREARGATGAGVRVTVAFLESLVRS